MSSWEDIKTHLIRIEEKIDKNDEKVNLKLDEHTSRLNSLDITSARNEKELSYHIKMYNDLKADVKVNDDAFDARITPLTEHVNFVQHAWKFLLGVAAIVATIVAYLSMKRGG